MANHIKRVVAKRFTCLKWSLMSGESGSSWGASLPFFQSFLMPPSFLFFSRPSLSSSCFPRGLGPSPGSKLIIVSYKLCKYGPRGDCTRVYSIQISLQILWSKSSQQYLNSMQIKLIFLMKLCNALTRQSWIRPLSICCLSQSLKVRHSNDRTLQIQQG